MMNKPTLKQIAYVMKSYKMKVFSAPFDMTLGGIRTVDNRSNAFNDWLFMLYHDSSGQLCGIVEPGTTDAGLYYRKHPMNVEGTAVIMHGFQYRGVYEYQNPKFDGKPGHKGQEAFRLVKPLLIVRDVDRDVYLDFDGEVKLENAATNGHDMGTVGKNVDKWSAGCWGSTNVIMDRFYALAKIQQAAGLGSKFSFAMLHETMFSE